MFYKLKTASSWHVVSSQPPASVVAGCAVFKLDGTQESPVKDVRISSLTLRHAAPTYMANYSVGSGGDYSVHRGGAVTMVGTEN